MVRVLTVPIMRLQQHIIGDEVNSPDYGNTWEDSYFQLNRRVMNIFVFYLDAGKKHSIAHSGGRSIDIPVVGATTHANGKELRRDY